MRITVRCSAVLLAALAGPVLAACQGTAGLEALGGVPQGRAVASIAIAPSGATLTAIGALQQFTATAEDSSSLPVAGVHFTWSSLDTTVLTVDSSGVARAVANGTTGVIAQSGGVTGTASVTVSAP
jgi:Bacterial Ig-like domain